MSKIGRKPIEIGAAKIEIKDNSVLIAGKKTKLTHELPVELEASLKDGKLFLNLKTKTRKNNMIWGLHRALVANKIKGAQEGFEKILKIVGLGFKAQLTGKNLVFSLGYSHKIDYKLPENVDLEIDKTGQRLVFKSFDKFLLGNVCDAIRSFRPPEPYKGTGIMVENEQIVRKAGKTKAAAA